MARQPGVMAEQVAHCDAIGRDGVMQAEFRDVIAHRLFPIEASLVERKGQARGGKGLRDRADHELRVGGHLQAGFDIAQTIGADQRHLPVLHFTASGAAPGTNSWTVGSRSVLDARVKLRMATEDLCASHSAKSFFSTAGCLC
jgi:hypothetical protein